jgi:hypothetical protein
MSSSSTTKFWRSSQERSQHSTQQTQLLMNKESTILRLFTCHLSPEYLNSLTSSNLPLSQLKLKIGCPVMILQNLAAAQGVCVGGRTCFTTRQMTRHVSYFIGLVLVLAFFTGMLSLFRYKLTPQPYVLIMVQGSTIYH